MKNIFFLMLLSTFSLSGQEQTVGLFSFLDDTQDGFVLFAPFRSTSTFLINNCGELVNEWESDLLPAVAVELMENGHLMRAASPGVSSNPVFAFGGGGERLQELDWQGNVIWEFIYSDETHRMHHDFARLPNGNILIPAWELKTMEEAIQAGRNPTLLPDEVLWAEYVIEVNPTTDEIVWEWHMWDHLIQDYDETKDNFGIIAEHPELLNINQTGGPTANGGKNWLQVNSIDYNPMMDQVLINTLFLSEFYVIDHSTSTSQAAGHVGGNSSSGGDFLYRWGNPPNYNHGTSEDRVIYGSHTAHWISDGLEDAGKIMYFNNGNGRPDGSYSSIDIINPPIDDYETGLYIYDPGIPYGPNQLDWTYFSDPKETFYSNFLSNGQRLDNGNTLICSGASGLFFEINKNKEIVWKYISPIISGRDIVAQFDTIPVIGVNDNIVFRSLRYNADYSGLVGQDLAPKDPLEDGFISCDIITPTKEVIVYQTEIYPNPTSEYIDIRVLEVSAIRLQIFDTKGQLIETKMVKGSETLRLDVSNYVEGIYFIEIGNGGVQKFVVNR